MNFKNNKIYKKWLPWLVLLINSIIATFVDAIFDFDIKIFSFQVIAVVLLLIKASIEIAQEVHLKQFSNASIVFNYICSCILTGVFIYVEYRLNHFITTIIISFALMFEIVFAVFYIVKQK